MKHPPPGPENHHERPHTPGREAEAFAEIIRSAVTSWLDDHAPRWVHLALVLDVIDPIFDTARVLDIVTHTLDEHPDYRRLSTGPRPLLVSDGTYAWCVWELVDGDVGARLDDPRTPVGASV